MTKSAGFGNRTTHHTAQRAYPLRIDVERPARFERSQVLLRILALAALGVVHMTAAGSLVALYVLLPLLVALTVREKGGERFAIEDAPWLEWLLEWVIGAYAYLLFVSDSFPFPSATRRVRLAVRRGAAPTRGEALGRLVTSLPHALVLAVLGAAAALVSSIAALLVLLTGSYPEPLWSFQRDFVGWLSRVFAYHVCLVDQYPPMELRASEETIGPGTGANGVS